MEANPYANNLGDRDFREVLPTTPGLVHEAVCRMTPEQIEAPHAPGKWSVREIVAHLADCEIAFGFRLRQVLAGDGVPVAIQPFDQAAWATRYAGYDLPSGLALYKALREWNLKLVDGVAEPEFGREGMHPERGMLTFRTILETMAGHDLNHLVQVQRVAGIAS